MTTDFPIKTVCVVGLGLIGGSFAKALGQFTGCRVHGCERNPASRAAALADGAIEAVAQPEGFRQFDLFLFALYPRQAVDFILQNLENFRPGAVLVDLCGVKSYLAEQLSAPCAAHGLVYIGGHPMAGKERWGYACTDPLLYQGASMLLTPGPGVPPGCLEALESLFRQVGFSRTVCTTPKAHDEMIAFTSQLAHIASSAYVKSPRAQRHDGFSAGSYRDMTRVARLNPGMWTELFLENAPPLLEEIDTLIGHLAEYRNAIARQDADALYRLLDEGRQIKEALDNENDSCENRTSL